MNCIKRRMNCKIASVTGSQFSPVGVVFSSVDQAENGKPEPGSISDSRTVNGPFSSLIYGAGWCRLTYCLTSLTRLVPRFNPRQIIGYRPRKVIADAPTMV